MNINFNFQIPAWNVNISQNMFLSPIYATVEDIYLKFFDEDPEENLNKYYFQIEEFIFNYSKEFNRIFPVLDIPVSEEIKFMIKNEYVVCKTVYAFGSRFYKDYATSISKSKFLADLKVSLEISKDPGMIKGLLDDAKNCADEIKKRIALLRNKTMQTYVKGEANAKNKTVNPREWFPSTIPRTTNSSFANAYISNFTKKYKIGLNNIPTSHQYIWDQRWY